MPSPGESRDCHLQNSCNRSQTYCSAAQCSRIDSAVAAGRQILKLVCEVLCHSILGPGLPMDEESTSKFRT